jgi:hypothetical protein
MSTVTATPAPSGSAEAALFPPLKPADRSDAVPSAQALVRVVKGTKDLLLDGHSYTKYEADLIADGWTVFEDIREVALNKPTAAY